MDCGRCCFAVFASSIISLALLITSMSVPYHIVVVTNPYARYVLGSGQLDSWSANRMGLDSDLLKELEENYVEFIRNLLPDIDYGDSEGREMKTGLSHFFLCVCLSVSLSHLSSLSLCLSLSFHPKVFIHKINVNRELSCIFF